MARLWRNKFHIIRERGTWKNFSLLCGFYPKSIPILWSDALPNELQRTCWRTTGRLSFSLTPKFSKMLPTNAMLVFSFTLELTHWSRYPGVYYTCYWCAVPISLFVPDLRNCSCHVVKKRNETSWIFDLLLCLSQFCFSFSQDEPNSCLVCVCVWGKLLSRKAPCLRLCLT